MLELTEFFITHICDKAHRLRRKLGIGQRVGGGMVTVLVAPLFAVWILAAALSVVFTFLACLVLLVLFGPRKARALYEEVLYKDT